LKTLGIIGGIGPESTIDYYRSIISLYRARSADGSAPSVIIDSIDNRKMLDFLPKEDFDGLREYLLAEISRLAWAGADVALLAANTPHIIFPDIQARSPLPLISIVEATCAVAQERQLHRLALFGTRFTMQGKFYPDVFGPAGITIVAPITADQDFIHEIYMTELIHGIFRPETRAALLSIVERMKKDERIDGVILGGTELPLLLKDEAHAGILLINTTKVHVEAAVERMLS
jgi:aspartate racemase